MNKISSFSRGFAAAAASDDYIAGRLMSEDLVIESLDEFVDGYATNTWVTAADYVTCQVPATAAS